MKNSRIASIDILRAITMLLMIWVNDFFTLKDIPKWLTHAKASEDYLGFSDIIFPLFLFIVGLSIPFAVEQRQKNGFSILNVTKHIGIRSISLLIIGVFMVNYETAHNESMLIGKSLWCLFMALGVTLIWMNWKKSPINKKWHSLLQTLGALILVFLAIIYKGGATGNLWMTTQWWGILGLIGWAYLINALIYLYSKGNTCTLLVAFITFNCLAVFSRLELLPQLNHYLNWLSVIYNGTIPAFTSAGIIAALILKKLSLTQRKWGFILFLVVIGIISISYGLITRPIWGISKIQGTPSWLGICTGIGFISIALLYFITDLKNKTHWARFISAAGTATLTCYMIPYFVYPLRSITDFRLPEFFNTGIIGLLISFIFAILVVRFTGWLEVKGFKLKL